MNIIAATARESEFIDQKIDQFNSGQVPFTQNPTYIYKNYVIKESSKIIAGINTFVYGWKILYIGVLFVEEQYRNQHLGSQLLQHAENEALTLGCSLSHLDTFDFQAKDFYLKQGYELFGVLENCPPHHNRYYLKKILGT
ncbi:MAG: GNAT family N-acetyltransferase [Legionellaceae bacterium]|nr:GNAT family N-acetyltransferase [Legionellaceae bacterium]